jgi:hypothetical protein
MKAQKPTLKASQGIFCPTCGAVTGISVVCLESGKELAYSWSEKKAVSRFSRRFNRVTLRSFLVYLWGRWPITTVTIALVIAVWAYDDLSGRSVAHSATLLPSAGVRYVPAIPVEPSVESQHSSHVRTATSRARDSKTAPAAFKRTPVGPNEVDYVGEDVTIRLFRPTPAPDLNGQLDAGEVGGRRLEPGVVSDNHGTGAEVRRPVRPER